MAEREKPEYKYVYDRLSGTGIIVRRDGQTSLRYTGQDAQRLRKMSKAAVAREAKGQHFS